MVVFICSANVHNLLIVGSKAPCVQYASPMLMNDAHAYNHWSSCIEKTTPLAAIVVFRAASSLARCLFFKSIDCDGMVRSQFSQCPHFFPICPHDNGETAFSGFFKLGRRFEKKKAIAVSAFGRHGPVWMGPRSKEHRSNTAPVFKGSRWEREHHLHQVFRETAASGLDWPLSEDRQGRFQRVSCHFGGAWLCSILQQSICKIQAHVMAKTLNIKALHPSACSVEADETMSQSSCLRRDTDWCRFFIGANQAPGIPKSKTAWMPFTLRDSLESKQQRHVSCISL